MGNFTSKKPHYHKLQKKWTLKHQSLQSKLWEKHGESLRRQLALGAAGGLMMLSVPTIPFLPQPHIFLSDGANISGESDNSSLVVEQLSSTLPPEVRPLTSEEEDAIGETLSASYGIKVSAELEGKRLNRSYGLIGGEQHLYRYPGDNLNKHSDSASDFAMFNSSGIAPGLGAWGYFAPSENQFDDKAKMRERYYIAVQTFLAPGFAEHTGEYRDFFKFRKMLLVNPKTGQAVVTDIGDAGPAAWTGKHLGGSPEVMHAVGLATGPRKGPVLYFFIDDPDDKVPLGPIKARGGTIAKS